MSVPHRIGLTGGIGSGKSSVAAMFEQLGVAVLDLDRVGRDIVTIGSTGLGQLVEAFGAQILQADGSLNRAALASHCFHNEAETKKLNAIMHPLIWQAESQWLTEQQGSYVIIEASVLLESGGAVRMDGVIVVLADEQVRLQRVLKRGDRDETAFRAIVARQCSDKQRRAQADWIIDNSGTLEGLHQQVCELHEKILTTM